MPELTFKVEDVQPVTFAAAPLLSFTLAVRNASEAQLIQSIALRCQVQIDALRRSYSAQEQQKLVDLFGEPRRWDRTLKSMLWVNTSTTVATFEKLTTVELPVQC